MKILLVGNYLPDKQYSMLRFADMLQDGLTNLGHEVRVIRPRPIVGTTSGIPVVSKWLRYLDKYVLFPAELRDAVKWADVVHICDHSNAVYVGEISKPCVVTCHDVLAIRGALGEETYCPASKTGLLLQKWILDSLTKAPLVACSSNATRSDLLRLSSKPEAETEIVLLAVARQYKKLAAVQPPVDKPFLLLVGSSEARKNRAGALRIFSLVQKQFDCCLIIAGAPLSPDLRELAAQLGVADRVIEMTDISDDVLVALYNTAFALLFPSFCEGFGLPIIEAQACGCPVVCADKPPLDEVGGAAALMSPVESEAALASSILSLRDADLRTRLIEQGLENVQRFTTDRMCRSYVDAYERMINRAPVVSKR